MKVDTAVENTSPLGRKLTVTVSRADIDQKVKDKLIGLRGKVNLKGWSKGREIPLQVLQKEYGPSVEQEVTHETIEHSFGDALRESNFRPAAQPEINDIENKPDTDLKFSATFEILPEIDLKPFSEYSLTKKEVTITEDDTNRTIERMRKQTAKWDAVERAAQSDDRVKVDFVRTMTDESGEVSDPEEENNAYVVLGQKGNVAEIDTALMGVTPSDEAIVIEFSYPEDWHEQSMSGKTVSLSTTVKAVEEPTLLEDSEFAKSLGLEEGEVDKISSKVQEELTKIAQDSVMSELKDEVLAALPTAHEFEIPTILLDKEIEQLKQDPKQDQEIDLEAEAVRRIKVGLVVAKIIEVNDLKADKERLHAEVMKMAQYYGGSPEIVKAYYQNPQLLGTVEQMVLLDDIVKMIDQQATIETKSVTFEELTGS